ncbi:pre-60S ribosomal particles component [Mycoemilia scoparia]|uniref:Pre-60S ribosomal particles component n=1 Tax=Mycoemilia scoparia TaxID=417184 RepID=A0A9W7ZSY3_9FUNG|nr:pre-60S ribosomal particles component [Mycoemilia scoparia]
MPKPTTGKSKGSLSLLVEKGSKNSVQKELSEKKDAGKKRLAEEECISGEEEEEEDDDDEEKDKSNSSDDDNKNENEEGDDDDDDDDDISSVLVKNKKTKKAKTATEEEFAGAMAAILGQSVKSLDKDAPIMAKNKSTEKKIEKEKIEYKARKAITTERKALLSKDRVIPDMRNFEYEKRLRKVATRGGKYLAIVLISVAAIFYIYIPSSC